MKDFEEIERIASRCIHCANPNCVKKCPLGNRIPDILEAVCNHQIDLAKNMLLQTSSSAYVCSRLCDFERKCYGACVLNKTKDKGIPFYEVESYLANFIQKEDFSCDSVLKKEKVAIIGAGISGITIAIEFAKTGFDTTLFEKNDRIGGVISDSLPNFRFDDSVVIKEYMEILNYLNVKINYHRDFGKNLHFIDLENFDIIVFALGTSISKSLFDKNQYIIDSMDVLKSAKRNQEYMSGKRVVVIGGGNVAIDVARTLIRNNNEVSIVYRRDLENAPASKKEIEEALNDGVQFLPLFAPIRPIYHHQELIGLEVERTKVVETLNSGRKNFVLTGEKTKIDAQIIVEAIGQNADYHMIKEKYPTLFNKEGWVSEPAIIVDKQRIIAITGDFLTGPSDFATASMTAKKTFQNIMEIIK